MIEHCFGAAEASGPEVIQCDQSRRLIAVVKLSKGQRKRNTYAVLFGTIAEPYGEKPSIGEKRERFCQ